MRAIRWTIRIVALLFVALVLASIAVIAFGIYIDLMPMRGPIEAAASDALRRPVTIEKRLQLQPTLTPTLEVQGLRIGDPGGSDAEDVLYLELARIQLDLIPLLRGEIRIHEVTAEGVAANIVLGQMRGEPQPEGQAPAAGPDAARVGEEPPPLTFEEIVDLTLKDIVVVVRNPKTDATYKFLLSELSGAAAKGEPLRLTAKGSYQGQDYSFDIGGASLNDLVQLKWAWPLAMSIDVAGVSFELTPEDDAAAAQDTTQPTAGAQYHLSLNAGRLDKLSPIVGVDLPPMGPITIEGRFGATENRFSISSLDIQIGTSDLHGEFEYDATAERPRADIRLLSKLTQLHDFTFESWSLASGEVAEAESPVRAVEGEKRREERALLSPEVLTALDVALRLKIDDVRSGEERLGGGELNIALENGRFTLDPFQINFPQGPIQLRGVVEATTGRGMAGTHMWPLELSGEIAKTKLEILRDEAAGTAADTPRLAYTFSLEGERLDNFDAFTGLSLPPLGPYSVRARMEATDTYYAMHELEMKVARSDLNGSFLLDVDGERPRSEIKLKSNVLQLDDFVFENWSLTKGASEPTQPAEPAAPAAEDAGELKSLIEPEVLRSFDGVFELEIVDVHLQNNRLGGGKLKITLDRGRVTMDPLQVNLPEGPVKVTVVLDSTEDAGFEDWHVWPAEITGDVAGAKLKIRRIDPGKVGAARYPMNVAASGKESDSEKGIAYELSVKGDRLDSFNRFADASLPPLGPYSIEASAVAFTNEYTIPKLVIRVGDSDLQGNMRLTTSGTRPRGEVKLKSERLQLNDFIFEDWSLVEAPSERPSRDKSEGEAEQLVSAEDVEALLTPEVMRRFDGKAELNVQQILLGEEKLGSGTLGVVLEKGRLDINPVTVKIPGGLIDMAFNFEPTDIDVTAGTKVDIEKFDYGIIARRIEPNTDMEGLFSLDIDLQSTAPAPEDLMAHANGHFAFGVWPENIEAGVIDLWSVNLFIAVMPALDKEQSKVNCTVGRFQMTDGVMKKETLLVDTSRMQVDGDGQADFKTQHVQFKLAPTPKKAQFFSLQTPIQVDGDFGDFKVGLPPGALLGTSFRFVTSIVTTPIQRIFNEEIPADGSAACEAAYAGETG